MAEVRDDADKHGPGLKFPPPLLPLLVIGLALLIDSFYPLALTHSDWRWWIGVALLAAALLLAVIALGHFFTARTHVEPWHPTSTIIQTGVFRYSRNPIYLAFCIALLGVGLLLNSFWVLTGLPLLVLLLRLLVINREEAYLEKKFGEDYLDYKQRVRRWI